MNAAAAASLTTLSVELLPSIGGAVGWGSFVFPHWQPNPHLQADVRSVWSPQQACVAAACRPAEQHPR